MITRLALMTVCATAAILGVAHAGDLQFSPVAFAGDDAARRKVIASDRVTMDGQTAAIGFHLLARSGDNLGGNVFGQMAARDGISPARGDAPYANAADFTSLLPVGGKLYSITQFEHNPATPYLSLLHQDGDGNLTPVWTQPVDTSAVGGIWMACAGVVTAWNTHLGSEEYAPDARAFETAAGIGDLDDKVQSMARYFGLDKTTMTLADFKAVFTPYRYGFPTEIAVSAAAQTSVAKHYSMGRVSVELANVMPDGRTAYISDDGGNTGLFMFVADQKADLRAGNLFAAHWAQTSDAGGGAATLDWIDLGHADDATIRAAIEGGTRFSDIFETAEITDGATCPAGFLSSNAEDRAECLKVKPGMEVVASRLETRRYASMLGATTEFRKMEGTAYNPDKNLLYVAMSEVIRGMTDADPKSDPGGRNDVRLPKNPCGTVFQLTLGADYRATAATGLISGLPIDYPADSLFVGNTCDVEGIANPDNLTYIPGHDTLIIAEDSNTGHRNDVIWSMNLASGELTRILSTPYGAEATSVDWYPDVNGHAYLMAVVQHPYGETDKDLLRDPADARAYVGYIGPFPAVR